MSTVPPTDATSTATPIGSDDLVSAIDERIALIDRQLDTLQGLREERERLLRARHALVGGEHGVPERRLSAGAVLAVLEDNPRSTAGEIAALLGYGDAAVRAHLHRARQAGRCAARDRRWSSPTGQRAAPTVGQSRPWLPETEHPRTPPANLLSSGTDARPQGDDGPKPLHDRGGD